MDNETKARIFEEGGKLASGLLTLFITRPKKPSHPEKTASARTEEALLGPPEGASTIITQEAEKTPKIASQSVLKEDISVACVPCAIGHFSTTAGLLNEAVRFKKEGIASNEILDRIGKALEEQNALERIDLTPENILTTKEWEKPIAEEALEQSRALRHKLESIQSIKDLEQAAADTERYYKKLNREWYKGRFAHLGKEKAEIVAELAERTKGV